MEIRGILTAAVASGFLLAACTGEPGGPDKVDFDRQAMLVNYADSLILPGYAALNSEVATLQTALQAFTGAPAAESLDSAQAALKSAWIAWQQVEVYEFGPAKSVMLRQSLNTFPTKVATIENHVAAGTWNLEMPGSYEAKGFPALDYLLNGTSDSTVLEGFTGGQDSLAQNRRRYAEAVAADIQAKVNQVYTQWTPEGGNYRNQFIAAMGTDVGSSLGQLVNELNFEWELGKHARLRFPAGLGDDLLNKPAPEEVEAYYGGYSAELARTNYEALGDLYRGEGVGGSDGLGMDDYLVALDGRVNGPKLDQEIEAGLARVDSALADVPDPLSQAISTHKSEVDSAYKAVAQQVRFFKSDMASAFGVSITYNDGDND